MPQFPLKLSENLSIQVEKEINQAYLQGIEQCKVYLWSSNPLKHTVSISQLQFLMYDPLNFQEFFLNIRIELQVSSQFYLVYECNL